MIGDRLGKWVIFKELGRGGMGRVYLAQEELTGKQAALKVLAAELAQEAGFLQRFQREIEALAKLDHPNIVRFFESGCENGHYFYAMEYVEGLSLAQLLEKQSRFPWQDVLNVAMQVAPALRHVHDHGIIHRDIKPSNLILSTAGVIKLTDFGIAKVFASNHLTATGGIVGTAEFLSPEQAAGKVVGKRSDLYCLGCVLYMLLTGRPPFSGSSYVELLHKHRYGQFDRPIKFVPDVPVEIDEMVCGLLEKDPEKRPRDAQLFLKQLETVERKLRRQGDRTSTDNKDAVTKSDNRSGKIAGSAAAFSNGHLSAKAEDFDRSGTLSQFFHHPATLIAILLLCVGFLVYRMLPLSEEQLFERGKEQMDKGTLFDMQRAWSDYLEPLERNYPDHAHKEEVAELRARWEAAKAAAPSEAQRFYQQGEVLQKQGDFAGAQRVWTNLIGAFGEVPAEKAWVQKAERALENAKKESQARERLKSVKSALERADEFRRAGKQAEAERIWSGLEELYRNDAAAAEILLEVRRARHKQQ